MPPGYILVSLFVAITPIKILYYIERNSAICFSIDYFGLRSKSRETV